MQLAAGSLSRRGLAQKPRFSTSPAPGPAPTNVPGVYGGPPGSFITSGRACPPGYMASPLSRGEVRCIPRPRPVAPPPRAPIQPPAPSITMPPITVSPVMQQSFTPQFSPVMQMTQDSPGAAISAAPEQVAAPEQAARTVAPSAPLPMPAPVDYGPPPPSAPSFDVPVSAPQSIPASFSDWPVAPDVREAIEAEKGKGNMIPWILAAAGLGLFLFTRKQGT